MALMENREAKYNNGLAKIVTAFALGCVEADNSSKDAYVDRQIELMGQEEPNVEFLARTSLIGLDQALETQVSVPKIVLAPSRPIVIDRAFLSLDMTVSAHEEYNSALQSDTALEGEGSAGFGPFKASLKIKAAVSVSKEQKRSADYTSTTHAELTMCQGEAPEGLMKIIDSLNMTTTRALELNAQLIERQYEALIAEAETPALETTTTTTTTTDDPPPKSG